MLNTSICSTIHNNGLGTYCTCLQLEYYITFTVIALCHIKTHHASCVSFQQKVGWENRVMGDWVRKQGWFTPIFTGVKTVNMVKILTVNILQFDCLTTQIAESWLLSVTFDRPFQCISQAAAVILLGPKTKGYIYTCVAASWTSSYVT